MPLDARQAKRRADYNAAFGTPAGRAVLADLHTFCMADQPTFSPDSHVAAFNEGMRRVYLRIRGFMKLTEEDMAALVADNAMRPQRGNDDAED